MLLRPCYVTIERRANSFRVMCGLVKEQLFARRLLAMLKSEEGNEATGSARV